MIFVGVITLEVIAAPLVDLDAGPVTAHESSRVDPLDALAVGRVALGIAAWTVPRRLFASFGMPSTPATDYLTRIYGARALALGAGYLSEPSSERRRWHRLGLAVDTCDTLTALGHLVRRDVPKRGILALGALTGSYTLVGLIQLLRGSVGQ